MRKRARRESGFNIIELRLSGLIVGGVAALLAYGLWQKGWHVPAIAIGVAALPMLVFGSPVLVVMAQAIADRVRGR